MGDMPGYLRTCLQTGKLFFLAILVSGGIVLQVLACALYDNWWPLLTAIIWVDVSKFLTGFSAVGSIAIPSILKHADIIGWGALGMQLASYLVFVLAIICFIQRNDDDDGYSSIF